ncbi:MAG: transposase [Bacteroidales bacterium]|jgi:hypothetical protein|nr:transposase [Bacteroidales bacterium]MDI9592581.1 transposase [Bacteroidota bacterium]OQC36917.1 MAG: Transposase zinc-ribbon domain protein [Bacteroidetes bacterium ADurb.Bin041]HNV49739.1 transposase [Bacteroidales bacterium]HOF80846.1 transposase [Bacteroidales bacterium]
MSNIFSQIGNIDLESAFQNADQCLELLAAEKWKDGYICRKCGNTNYCSGKTLHSRRCTRCKHDESATANTIFHRCKIPLNEAFKIAYIVCNQPDISTYDISRMLKIRQMTCWKFKKRISECLDKKGYFDVMEMPNS